LVADVIAELNATQASESSVDSQPLIDTSTEPFTEASTDPSTEASAPELVLGLAPQAKDPFSGDIQL
jgi:hypothetical protein